MKLPVRHRFFLYPPGAFTGLVRLLEHSVPPSASEFPGFRVPFEDSARTPGPQRVARFGVGSPSGLGRGTRHRSVGYPVRVSWMAPPRSTVDAGWELPGLLGGSDRASGGVYSRPAPAACTVPSVTRPVAVVLSAAFVSSESCVGQGLTPLVWVEMAAYGGGVRAPASPGGSARSDNGGAPAATMAPATAGRGRAP